ncbi:hypothetical protein [Pseudomonas pergaminensis]
MNGIFTASSIKKAVWSVVFFCIAWAATKAFDYFLDFTILSTIWAGILYGAALLKQEIPTPLWQLIALLLFALLLSLYIFFQNRTLHATNVENERLKNPPVRTKPPMPQLSDIEHSVLMTIAALLENNQCPDDHDIMEQLCLTRLPTQAAIDVLTDKSLITIEYDANFHNYWELTPKGRVYALNPENQKRK